MLRKLNLMSSKRNFVAVIGTTGVGKSQLAVHLAQSLRQPSSTQSFLEKAEILNADSMQIYANMDVITNKVTTEEMGDVPHHLMGFLATGEEYRVGTYQQDALEKVSNRLYCSSLSH